MQSSRILFLDRPIFIKYSINGAIGLLLLRLFDIGILLFFLFSCFVFTVFIMGEAMSLRRIMLTQVAVCYISCYPYTVHIHIRVLCMYFVLYAVIISHDRNN